ncbi:MAG: amidohydrolase, partial [Pseudomonadota bacterium]
PAEEGLGGARGMLSEGLFENFPCDEIYGMHNDPNSEPGKVGICKGTAMAGASFFDIHIQGKGSHAAMPHQSRDSLMIGTSLVGQLQTILSRNVPPLESCVLSVTEIHAGSAYNIVPDTARLAGTIRYFSDDVRDLAHSRMQELCDGIALAYGVEIRLELRNVFDVLINDAELSDAYLDAAADIVGKENVSDEIQPATGSEDFSDMLKVVSGSYCRLGHSGNLGLHNPGFFLDPEILPIGASIMARIVERRLTI